MARKKSNIDSLTALFDKSRRPIYAIDDQRRIAYCNRALAAWLDVDPNRIVGRTVEYHSEPISADDSTEDDGPLTDLCPPPQALAGNACRGTLSCMVRDGRLLHRRVEFMPLEEASDKPREGGRGYAILAILATADTSAQELAAATAAEPTADELHRTIRRFRRARVSQYSIESLLGNSFAMQRVRAQLAAAAASGANTLIRGRRGSGRGHVARAIHYSASNDAATNLLPIDCRLLSDDLLRRILERLRGPSSTGQRPTLLLENLESMSAAHQALLSSAIREKLLGARIIATCSEDVRPAALSPSTLQHHQQYLDDSANDSATVDHALWNAISTLTIELPPLTRRLEDLPVLAQYFLEACNHGSGKQVGAFRADALDAMALYSWPGELEQLRTVVTAAHRATTSHEIAVGDLPPIMHHASAAARHVRSESERIVLDELLATIEKETIVRALAEAGGNKSEAATLLGMTRPRLYRRLVQLGLVQESDPLAERPEFIERDATE